MKMIMEGLVRVLARLFGATVGLWAGSSMIHLAHPQVPEMDVIAALGVVLVIRALAWGIGDLIKGEDKA